MTHNFALISFSDLHINFVGDEKGIKKELEKKSLDKSLLDRVDITHASEIINMDDSPSTALRHKKDSSMRVAINLVQSGICDACISAGNTGALMSIARFVLKTIEGVNRPAIMSAFPTLTGPTHVLDLGFVEVTEFVFVFGRSKRQAICQFKNLS